MALLVVLRINEGYVSDFVMCLASNTLLAGLGELIIMPMLSLACQLCPKNLEGSVYSFFMSSLNFGGIMSGLNGSFLTSFLGITSKNFSRLFILIIISNVVHVLPLFFLFCIYLTYFQPELDHVKDNNNLPDQNSNEKNKNEKNENAKKEEEQKGNCDDNNKETIRT